MEIWENVEDLTSLTYQGKLIEYMYTDFHGHTSSGELIRINGICIK